MLDPALGRFDHVVAMDSLIHYRARDVVRGAGAASPRARAHSIVFTFAPRTPPLAVMHAVGPAVPARRPRAGDRAGGRRPRCAALIGARAGAAPAGTPAARERIAQRLLHLAGPGARARDEAADAPSLARGVDAASARASCRSPMRRRADLPLARLLRLSLFQVSVGMAMVLLIGTLNRVMIVELGVPAWLVALMVSLPLLFAPFRALLGFRSDTHRSVLGWRRVPYIWFGTLLQFGGLAIMPFALLVLSGDGQRPGLGRPGRRGARLPAGRRRPAHDADRRPGARHRPGARRRRGRASWRCST